MAPASSIAWRTLSQRPSAPRLPDGLDRLWDRMTGFLKRYVSTSAPLMRQAEQITSMGDDLKRLPDHTLKAQAYQLKELFLLCRDTADDRALALAVIREIAIRTIGLKAYPVQVAGAMALDSGYIVEMATGEGKTLSVALAGVLAGWRGRGCHVVTANDYLAKRDAVQMDSLYRFCGLTVDHIQQDSSTHHRRRAYHCDVTYCTSREVAADFLRDQLVLGRIHSSVPAILQKWSGTGPFNGNHLVQRGLTTAIVDEADSVLIDEAMTPLIISGHGANQQYEQTFVQAAQWARELEQNVDFTVNKKYREIQLTPRGKERTSDLAKSFGGVWAGARRREEMIIQALTVDKFFIRDEQYVIKDGKIIIVDEFTGRLMPDRSWQKGIHQAVEAKENLEIHLPRETLARMSFQRFFRYYKTLSGTTGTGADARDEFWRIYHLPVVVIPTHRPCRRKHLPMRVCGSKQEKWAAIVKEIRDIHEKGRPVLVGTRSVKASEHLSRLLLKQGLDHNVLNAVLHEQEARIIREAGQKGRITVATNMAARGTDICLENGVADRGGLHVIASERHEAGRIDRQLYGRTARQGDPGSCRAYVSLDDELFEYYSGLMLPLAGQYFSNSRQKAAKHLLSRMVRKAQKNAEKKALAQRADVLQTDKWMDDHLGFTGNAF